MNHDNWWGTNHSWNKWERIKETEIFNYNSNLKFRIGWLVVQRRKCEVCGLEDYMSNEVKI